MNARVSATVSVNVTVNVTVSECECDCERACDCECEFLSEFLIHIALPSARLPPLYPGRQRWSEHTLTADNINFIASYKGPATSGLATSKRGPGNEPYAARRLCG